MAAPGVFQILQFYNLFFLPFFSPFFPTAEALDLAKY